MNYSEFIQQKTHLQGDFGFDPLWMPDMLFDFQKSLVEWALKKGRAALFEDCGLGKGQPKGDLILTSDGWKKNTALTIGDKIIASDGKSYDLTGIYYKSKQPTWRVWFSDNTSFVVDSDHLHIVRTNNDRQRGKNWRVMSTQKLLTCSNLRYSKKGKSRNYDIPVVLPVEFSNRPKHKISPYIIGVLLGDGGLTSRIILSNCDKDLLDRVKRELPYETSLKQINKCDWRINTKFHGNKKALFKKALYELGMTGKKSYQKSIPYEYLYDGNIQNRIDLLRGLMDTDGYIMKCGTSLFYSTSEQLANDVLELVRSLGGIPTFSKKKTLYKKKHYRDCFVVTFSLKNINPFYITRKAQRWNPEPRDNGRWIDRIEYEKEQETICLAVDSPDHSYVTENYIVTHNTFQYLTIAENVVRKTNKRILILTPLAVCFQTVLEGEKLGIEVTHRRNGIQSTDKIVVTNYERLHYFNPSDFVMLVCDESSILKNPDGFTKDAIIDFARKLPYRLLCTATASPNDFIELGTSSEALGYMGFSDMLITYFKKAEKTYSRRKEHMSGVYRFRGHAEQKFWRWVCSWARAIRTPSDMGCDDNDFILPQLIIRDHVVKARTLPEGFLFEVPAVGQKEQNNELKRTVQERCEKAAEVHASYNGSSSVAWCYRNKEGELLEKLIPHSKNIYGSMHDEEKEDAFKAFASGEIKTIVSKPTIAGFGLNWQHCHNMTFFPSHSYEQFYQSVRRCYRFGQTQNVNVDLVTTDGQRNMLQSIQRKALQAEKMFDVLVKLMHQELVQQKKNLYTQQEELPSWL